MKSYKTTRPLFKITFLLWVALFSQTQAGVLFAAPMVQSNRSTCLPLPDDVMPPLIINEVLYNEAGSSGDEWVELYVTSDLPSGAQFLLSDNEENSGLFRRLIEVPATGIPEGTYIVIHTTTGVDELDPSDGLITLWGALGNGVAGTALRNSSDNLTLYQGNVEDDLNAIDYLRWGNDTTDTTNDDPPNTVLWSGFAPGGAANEQSIARILNGVDGSSGAEWAPAGMSNTFAPATPGQANGTTAVCRAALSLEKEVVAPQTGVAMPGDPVTYALQITNRGNITMTQLILTDTFEPRYLAYHSASIPPDTQAGGQLLWNASLQSVLPLAPGATVSVTVNFKLVQP